MRLHGLLVVRDEADIIPESVRYALTWADAIYAYDTGSTDGSWDILQKIAQEDQRLVLYRHNPVYFRNDLRAVLFEEYRKRMEPGDWVAIVDADEFYHISPREFITEHLRPEETAVCYQLYDFKLTKQEAENLHSVDDIKREKQKTIEQRRRHFIPIAYAEPRLFRYRPTMQWVPPKAPFNLGFMARQRIPVRHYPNRDPLQMEARYRLRLEMRPHVGFSASPHWDVKDWREMLVDNSPGDGIVYWQPGSPLPMYTLTNHLARPAKRLAQRMVHSMLLPILDRMRSRYPAGYERQRMPRAEV